MARWKVAPARGTLFVWREGSFLTTMAATLHETTRPTPRSNLCHHQLQSPCAPTDLLHQTPSVCRVTMSSPEWRNQYHHERSKVTQTTASLENHGEGHCVRLSTVIVATMIPSTSGTSVATTNLSSSTSSIS